MESIVEIPEKNLKLKISYSDSGVPYYRELKDNGTLLISEIQNKVCLPYTVEEVEAILNEGKKQYQTAQEVIDKEFTRELASYKDLHFARFREAVKLLTEREHFSKMDGYNLGIELFGMRYLHPAIISACKNLDELNVYLDCLEKNELDDFKIFKIKYELYPMMIEKGINNSVKIFGRKILEFIQKNFHKNFQKEK